MDPAMGTPSKPRTTTVNERPTATVITNAFDQIFDMAISNGVNGITSRAMVPCSRSRMIAAPARMIASMVTLLMIAMTLVNQAVVTFGLKAMRTSRLPGGRGHDTEV